MRFLCDTGACRTTCTKPFPNYTPSGTGVSVRASNGVISWAPLSTPAWIRDPKGGSCQLKILLTPQCPVNLLGRDALLKLQLALVPDDQGNIAVVRKGELPGGYVLQGVGQPVTYYTLQIPNKAPCKTGTALLQEGRLAVATVQDEMGEEDLHVTMRHSIRGGIDKKYEEKLEKATPALITLNYLYSDTDSCAAVGVKLTEDLQSLFSMWTPPHVSLYKDAESRWKDLGYLVQRGEKAKDWVATSVNTWYSVEANLTRKALFWSVSVQEGIHMKACEKA